jgi:hypothetical protein
MKNRLFCTALTVFAVTVSTPAWTQETPSVPLRGGGMPSGRSAKMAARLKYSPPNNYLKHYLGDDRYKIAGGVWKVVSTQLDTYYHRSTCPNMLRQHADIVIGFSHSRDAEEAGYRADSVCRPKEEIILYGQLASGITDYLDTSRRMTLADGSSSVVLPSGWRRLESRVGESFGRRYYVDTFQRRGAKGFVTIRIGSLADGTNAEPFLDILFGGKTKNQAHASGSAGQMLDELQKGMAATNSQLSQSAGIFGDGKRGKWAGNPARFINTPKRTITIANMRIPLPAANYVFAAKGPKTLTFMDTDGTKGALAIRNSFRMP